LAMTLRAVLSDSSPVSAIENDGIISPECSMLQRSMVPIEELSLRHVFGVYEAA
jgi:hypothetical protein